MGSGVWREGPEKISHDLILAQLKGSPRYALETVPEKENYVKKMLIEERSKQCKADLKTCR